MNVSRYKPVQVGDANVTGANPVVPGQVLVEVPLTGSATDTSWMICFIAFTNQFGVHFLVGDRVTLSTPLNEIEQRVEAVRSHVEAANAQYHERIIAPMQAMTARIQAQQIEEQRLVEEAKRRLEAAKKKP